MAPEHEVTLTRTAPRWPLRVAAPRTVGSGIRVTSSIGRLVTGAAGPLAAAVVRPAGRTASAVLDVVVPAVVSQVLRHVDVAEAITDHVDVDRVVAGVDIDAIIDRIDLVGLVNQVIDEIDLPEIIRESTGSLGSQTVRGVRMQGITADEAVERVVDRLRLRRQHTAPEVRPQDLR